MFNRIPCTYLSPGLPAGLDLSSGIRLFSWKKIFSSSIYSMNGIKYSLKILTSFVFFFKCRINSVYPTLKYGLIGACTLNVSCISENKALCHWNQRTSRRYVSLDAGRPPEKEMTQQLSSSKQLFTGSNFNYPASHFIIFLDHNDFQTKSCRFYAQPLVSSTDYIEFVEYIEMFPLPFLYSYIDFLLSWAEFHISWLNTKQLDSMIQICSTSCKMRHHLFSTIDF